MGRLVVASLQVLLCINDGSDDWKSFYHQGNARRSFLWRTSPSPRHWARRIWAHLSDRGRSITNLSRVIQISVYSSYSCIATSKFCLTVLPYQSSKQMAINVMSEVFRKFSGLYASLTVYELQTPDSELSYVLNDCGLRLQRSQTFSWGSSEPSAFTRNLLFFVGISTVPCLQLHWHTVCSFLRCCAKGIVPARGSPIFLGGFILQVALCKQARNRWPELLRLPWTIAKTRTSRYPAKTSCESWHVDLGNIDYELFPTGFLCTVHCLFFIFFGTMSGFWIPCQTIVQVLL